MVRMFFYNGIRLVSQLTHILIIHILYLSIKIYKLHVTAKYVTFLNDILSLGENKIKQIPVYNYSVYFSYNQLV